MVEVRGLYKRFGQLEAISDVSFEVSKGEVLGFLGPNGAGKSTTMKIITGYIPPTSGSASIAGFDIMDDPQQAKKLIGYLPETVPLYNYMRVFDYLDFAAELRGITKKRERRDRVVEAMEKCAVTDVQQRIIGQLSKGYKQRVGIAQAIVHNPEVLILDEPTIGLDPHQIIQVRHLIKDLKKNHTIILCSHILPEVSMTCNRVLIINKGRIVEIDSPEELVKKLQGTERVLLKVRKANTALLNKIEEVDGVTSVEQQDDNLVVESGHDLRGKLAATVVTGGWELLELRPVGMSLEQVFLHLTTEEEKEL